MDKIEFEIRKYIFLYILFNFKFGEGGIEMFRELL